MGYDGGAEGPLKCKHEEVCHQGSPRKDRPCKNRTSWEPRWGDKTLGARPVVRGPARLGSREVRMNFPCCKVAAYSSWVPISFTPIAPQRKEGLWSLGSGPQTRAGTLIPALHGVGSVSSELRKLLPAVVPRAVRHCGVCGGGGRRERSGGSRELH